MTRTTYVPEELGREVEAPAGYYRPCEEELIEHRGRRVLCVLGSACIEASCCGVSNWQYARVEGHVVDGGRPDEGGRSDGPIEVDTIDDENDRTEIRRLLLEKHPGVRVEFR